uniref:Uncharacterized protein n=1 Tax=Cannabis sativa TaxID=3483 RepID=A0A803NV49_CANSA
MEPQSLQFLSICFPPQFSHPKPVAVPRHASFIRSFPNYGPLCPPLLPGPTSMNKCEWRPPSNFKNHLRVDGGTLRFFDGAQRRRISSPIPDPEKDQIKALIVFSHGLSLQPQNPEPAQLAANTVANWKDKDCLLLVVSLATKKAISTSVSTDLVDVHSFFGSVIVPELQNLIRFLGASQMWFILMQQVVMKNFLLVKDAERQRYNSADISPILGALMTNLFNALKLPESEENQYIMKCIIVFLVLRLTPDIAGPCITGLTSVLGEGLQNPRNPVFNHYLFEAVAILAFLQKAPHELNQEGRLSQVLGIFKKLLSSYQAHMSRGFFVLNTHGSTNLVETMNAVQPNIFKEILAQFWVPNLKHITGPIETKLTAVASTRLLCESPILLDAMATELWGKMLDSVVTLVSRPEEDRVEEEPEMPDLAENVGYTASFVRLFNAGKKEEDPLKEIKDPKEFLVASLATLSASNPGRFPQVISQYLDPANQTALLHLCSTYNCPIA